MNAIALAQAYCVGGALLGLWGFVRFPRLAPPDAGRAMLALLAALVGLSLVPSVLGYAIDHGGKAGALAALLTILLPAVTVLFWSVACVFQNFAGLMKRG